MASAQRVELRLVVEPPDASGSPVPTAGGLEVAVVLLDRGLPFVDGLEVLARLRRRGWTTPVLVLSAYAAPPDRVAGLDAGAEDYLTKPFDVDELLARPSALQTPAP